MSKKGASALVFVICALSVVMIAFLSIVPVRPAVMSVIQIGEETLTIKECYQTKVSILSTLKPFMIVPLEENPGDFTFEVYLYSQGNLIASERRVGIGEGEYKITLAFWGSYETLEVQFFLLDSDGDILSYLSYRIS